MPDWHTLQQAGTGEPKILTILPVNIGAVRLDFMLAFFGYIV
jgi:hypothetical protein